MTFTPHRGRRAAALTGVLALTLAACSAGPATGDASGGLGGSLAGAGATSQERAVIGWIAGFYDLEPGVTVSYDAVGSGGGREQFLAGAVQFAGSDAALKEDELEQAHERCEGGEAVELPLYISPMAVVYNLPDLDAEHLQLSAATVARIFNRDITTWDDPEIAAENPGVDLPSLRIIPVNRSDESGTTENFTEYLEDASGGAWPHEASGSWPLSGGQSGNGNQGVLDTVEGAQGAVGYVDASRAGDLGTVALKVGEEYVPYSSQAAAAVVDASPRAEDATDTRLVVEIDRDTTAPGAYPLVLISYSLACSRYARVGDATNVKAYLSYVASPQGQARAADPAVAGAAPISDALRAEVQAAIDSITAG
ncbi:phosphate ABC transporter substrate-binding protein PstS [Cellulomonas phragmiteti]|uniref:Phosphate-binding protein n=1 Tax=Cellulomonas phragmiteti TaxID=478780 RepID=A0ABQ4DHP7_9CELL|nr:phosphate ABC transporter substrate-binding protein PstS [Cellulomonas phragmiteti]GIG38874.1 phosphate-binding protein PstS [Cellulomonas phragmiteti]